jgi:hypothetical protein
VPRLATYNTHSYQESSCLPQPPQPRATPPTPEVPWPSASRVPSLANDDALILDVPEYGFPYSSQQDSLQTSLKAHNVPQVNPVLVQFTDTADNLQFEVRHTDGDALPNTVLDHHDVHTQSSASQQNESSLMATTTTVGDKSIDLGSSPHNHPAQMCTSSIISKHTRCSTNTAVM